MEALKKRFNKKIKIVEHTGCWEWIGARWKDKYGKTSIGSPGKAKRAHRISWELFIGPIPKGAHVCHKCDNPPCVNPSHLFLGDNLDNVKDMVSKGRVHQKLLMSEVYMIRNLRSMGISRRRVAEQFNISVYAIEAIDKGLTWRWLK